MGCIIEGSALSQIPKVETQTLYSPLSQSNKPRRCWLAGLANLAPPLGHVYAGRPLRGVILILALVFLYIGGWLIILRPIGLPTVVLMALMVIAFHAVPIADAVIVARRSGKEYVPRWFNRWYVYLLVLAIVALLSDIVRPIRRSHLVQAYKIPSSSMAPTLLSGDQILTDKTVYKSRSPERFDVVVYEFPEDSTKTFAHRVIGLPGETIEIREKRVFINGALLSDAHGHFLDIKEEKPVANRDSFGPFQIPDDSYFVLGDRRDTSNDSRFWGPVKRDKIYGVVRLIFFSQDSQNGAVRWERIGKIVE
jgi:signal peptidase I